jgi:hypothetical protein
MTTFAETEGVVAYWSCCDTEGFVSNINHARLALENHEKKYHKGKMKKKLKNIGKFGLVKEKSLGSRNPITNTWSLNKPRLSANGMIRVDLNQPDEVCLLPAHWNGRYPKTTCEQRLTRLSEQQGHRCCYCGKRTWSQHYGETGCWQDMATVEHIVCRKHGGTNKRGNLAMACSKCNGDRGRSNPVVFMYEKLGLLDFELVPKEDETE